MICTQRGFYGFVKTKIHEFGSWVTVYFLLFQQNKAHCFPKQPTGHSLGFGHESEPDRWKNYTHGAFFSEFCVAVPSWQAEGKCTASLHCHRGDLLANKIQFNLKPFLQCPKQSQKSHGLSWSITTCFISILGSGIRSILKMMVTSTYFWGKVDYSCLKSR